jgi:hypothetical protein
MEEKSFTTLGQGDDVKKKFSISFFGAATLGITTLCIMANWYTQHINNVFQCHLLTAMLRVARHRVVTRTLWPNKLECLSLASMLSLV